MDTKPRRKALLPGALLVAFGVLVSGPVVGLAINAGLVLSIVWLGLGRGRQKTDRFLSAAAVFFLISDIVRVSGNGYWIFAAMANVMLGLAAYSILRPRFNRVEPEIRVEAAIILAAATFAIVITYQLTSHNWLALVPMIGLAQIPVIALALGAPVLLAIIDQTNPQGRVHALLVCGAMTAAVAESLFSSRYTALFHALSELCIIAYLLTPASEEQQPATRARHRFTLTHKLLVMALISVSEVTLLFSDLGRSELRVLAAISLVINALVVYRIHLFVKLRDWSDNQATVLREFGIRLVSGESQPELARITRQTLFQLTGPEGRAAIITASPHMRVLSNSETIGMHLKPTTTYHFGDNSPAVRQWLHTGPVGAMTIAVRVPGIDDERYLVATTPNPMRAEVEDDIRNAAAHYGLALSNLDLALAVTRAAVVQRYNALTQDSSDLVMVLEPETFKPIFISESTKRLLNIGPNQNDAVYKALDIVERAHRPQFRALIEEARKTRTKATGDLRLQVSGQSGIPGKPRWFQTSIRDLSQDSDIQGILMTSTDIDDRKNSEVALRDSERRYRTMVQNSTDVSMLVDANDIIRYISPNVQSCFGFDEAELTGTRASALIHQSQVGTFLDTCSDVLETGQFAHLEVLLEPHRSISLEPLQVEVMISDAELGDEDQLVVLVRDVTVTRQLEQALRDKTMFDESTGLLNRPAFAHALETKLRNLPPSQILIAGCINLQNYRTILQREGFTVSDAFCAEVACRLRTQTRANDTLARLSSDQFGFITAGQSVQDGNDIARRLLASLSDPIAINNHDFTAEASVGLTSTDDRQFNPQALLQQATVSADHAAKRGHGQITVFEQSFQDDINKRYELSNDLHQSSITDQFHLVYQPLIGAIDHELEGLEALIRWIHPVKGFISPAEFIPLAEENGSIASIGRWVMRNACDTLASLQAERPELQNVRMDINVSPAQLEKRGELEALIEVISSSRIKPSSVIVELTESVVSDAAWIQDQLREFRKLGVAIAIDDFGSGVAGLSHLRDFPVDMLKFDKSYIDPIADNSESRMLLNSIIKLAHDLGIVTVAEGVEDVEQVDILRHLGCDILQGYYFARPMTMPDLNTWLDQHQELLIGY